MAETFALPADARLFDLREQILFIQDLACRFYAAENWWAAFKAMTRVELLSRRLPKDNFLAQEAYAAFPGLETHLGETARPSPPPRASSPSRQEPAEPNLVFEAPPADPVHAHVRLMRQICAFNAKRQRDRKPTHKIGAFLPVYERQWGKAEADKIRALDPKQEKYLTSG